MTIQDLALFSLAPAVGQGRFADPEWRGGGEETFLERRLRPLSEILAQISRLAGWISAGDDYGWLGAYQARRAAFELQSVRVQIAEESGRIGGVLSDEDRWAVQARLDRLEACIEAARASLGVG
jgi:hypothetical protein